MGKLTPRHLWERKDGGSRGLRPPLSWPALPEASKTPTGRSYQPRMRVASGGPPAPSQVPVGGSFPVSPAPPLVGVAHTRTKPLTSAGPPGARAKPPARPEPCTHLPSSRRRDCTRQGSASPAENQVLAPAPGDSDGPGSQAHWEEKPQAFRAATSPPARDACSHPLPVTRQICAEHLLCAGGGRSCCREADRQQASPRTAKVVLMPGRSVVTR